MASIAPSTVVIFNQDGNPEKHSRANARDLVQHCGYSWVAGIKSAPNHPSSFGGRQPPKGESLSQLVLDTATGDADKDGEAATTAAEKQLEAEVAEQRAQLEALQAAAKAASQPADDNIPDFSKPVETNDEGDADIDAELEDEGADAPADEPALQPTARGRKRTGRSA